MAIDDEIAAIEAEMLKTQKNKATEHHLAKLKAKVARLRAEQEKRRAAGGGGGRQYAVKKSGHATVALVGLPSVGKSTLLNHLTAARSEVAAYEFTTLDIIPGLLEHRGAKIQVLDMPGLIRGASKGRGRGREVISVARTSDLVLCIVDVFQPHQLHVLLDELADAGIRVNERPPEMRITHRDRGGVTVEATARLTRMTIDEAVEIARAFGLVNADIVIRENASPDRLVDYLAGNRVYIPAIVALNKIDLATREVVARAVKELDGWRVVPISSERDLGLAPLKDALYEALRFLRVYLKPHGGEADMKEPLVVKTGATVGDVCELLHRDFRRLFRYALVTGKSAAFANQTVGLEHKIADGDVLTIVTKRTG